MKKNVLIVMLGVLLIGGNVFAQGDLLVNGRVAVGGAVSSVDKLRVQGSDIATGLFVTNAQSTGINPVTGSTYEVTISGTNNFGPTAGMVNRVQYNGARAGGQGDLILNQGVLQLLSQTPGTTNFNADLGLVGFSSGLEVSGARNYNGDFYGINVSSGRAGSYSGTYNMANYFGYLVNGVATSGAGGGSINVGNAYGFYANTFSTASNNYSFYASGGAATGKTNNVGLWVGALSGATNNYGIVLDGDGAGSDLVFGAAGGTCRPSIYAIGGFVKAKNKNCIESPLSPHDPVTGEWIFYSKNLRTGKTVKVNMEKLVEAVEKLTGEKFMIQTMEEMK